MTYLQFHGVFILPIIALLLVLHGRDLRRGLPFSSSLWRGRNFAYWAVLIHVALALIYTTPWDNYLVYKQVWGYPPGRVLATIGYVPIEEYLFFVLQTFLTSLWTLWLFRHMRFETSVAKPQLVRGLGLGIALLLAALGLLCLSFSWGTYLGLILIWAGPVMALQWAFGGDLLLSRWRTIGLAFMLPSLYLWLADRIAIGLGIWWISPDLTTGIKVLGLPIEEALFFLLTNIFVAFGLGLALHPTSLARLRTMQALINWQNWWKATLLLWALSMIPTPLFPQAFTVLAYISTSLLALAVLGYAYRQYQNKAFILFIVAFGFGLFIEWLGKTSGFPFGNYRYTAAGPALFGVPLLVPLGWWAFSLIALSISPKNTKYYSAPLALVAWDLGLDPLMVSQGFWQFEQGLYYGIPLSNFLGWYVSGAVLVWLLLKLEPRLLQEESLELRLAFLAQAFLLTVGLVFFGMPLAGLLCFIAMASLAAWSFSSKAPKALRAGD